MKFFVPGQKDDASGEDNYAAFVKFAKETMGWNITTDGKRIRSIDFTHDGKKGRATVGEKEQYPGGGNELVLAILESNTYLVITPNRGGIRDMPIMVGKHEISNIEYFE